MCSSTGKTWCTGWLSKTYNRFLTCCLCGYSPHVEGCIAFRLKNAALPGKRGRYWLLAPITTAISNTTSPPSQEAHGHCGEATRSDGSAASPGGGLSCATFILPECTLPATSYFWHFFRQCWLDQEAACHLVYLYTNAYLYIGLWEGTPRKARQWHNPNQRRALGSCSRKRLQLQMQARRRTIWTQELLTGCGSCYTNGNPSIH